MIWNLLGDRGKIYYHIGKERKDIVLPRHLSSSIEQWNPSKEESTDIDLLYFIYHRNGHHLPISTTGQLNCMNTQVCLIWDQRHTILHITPSCLQDHVKSQVSQTLPLASHWQNLQWAVHRPKHMISILAWRLSATADPQHWPPPTHS